MTFAQRRNRLMTHFSERIPVVKRRINVVGLVGGQNSFGGTNASIFRAPDYTWGLKHKTTWTKKKLSRDRCL